MDADHVDHYSNLILVCPTDHARIDKQVARYSEPKLHELKDQHERWAKERRQVERHIRLRDPQPAKRTLLRPADSGTSLMSILGGSHAFQFSKPDDLLDHEIDVLAALLDELTDCIDLWPTLGLGEQLRAEHAVDKELAAVPSAGFILYAGVQQLVIEGGVGADSRWQDAYLAVCRRQAESTTQKSTQRPTVSRGQL